MRHSIGRFAQSNTIMLNLFFDSIVNEWANARSAKIPSSEHIFVSITITLLYSYMGFAYRANIRRQNQSGLETSDLYHFGTIHIVFALMGLLPLIMGEHISMSKLKSVHSTHPTWLLRSRTQLNSSVRNCNFPYCVYIATSCGVTHTLTDNTT